MCGWVYAMYGGQHLGPLELDLHQVPLVVLQLETPLQRRYLLQRVIVLGEQYFDSGWHRRGAVVCE